MKRIVRFAPLLVLLAVAAAVFASGVTRYVSFEQFQRSEAGLRSLVRDHVALALVAYVAVYMVATAVSIPGAIILTIAGGYLFGTWVGGGAAAVGATAGAILVFLAVRTSLGALLRERAERSGGRLKSIMDGVQAGAFGYILTLRLIPLAPFWLVNVAAALANAPLRAYALATAIGILPATFIDSAIGAGVGQVLARGEKPDLGTIFEFRILAPLVALGLLSLGATLYQRRKAGRAGSPMPRQIKADLVVIGAGSGGLSVAAGAAQLGLKVVLFEKGEMGGDCLNYGCVPSKALIAAADAAHQARIASRLGVRVEAVSVDFMQVMAHVRAAIAAIAPNDSQDRFEGLGVEVIREAASFINAKTVASASVQVAARKIVIATGSRAVVPPIPGLADLAYLTNETVFDLKALPEKLIVLGGGPIGIELGQAFRRLGSQVSIIDSGHMLDREERAAADVVLAQLADDGVELLSGFKAVRVEAGPTVVVAGDDGERRISGSHLLVAVGRAPSLARLELGLTSRFVR